MVDQFDNWSLGRASRFLLLACLNKLGQKKLLCQDQTYCDEDRTWKGLVVTNIVLALYYRVCLHDIILHRAHLSAMEAILTKANKSFSMK